LVTWRLTPPGVSGLAGLAEEGEAVEVVDPSGDEAVVHCEPEHPGDLDGNITVGGVEYVGDRNLVTFGDGFDGFVSDPLERREEGG
jgi:hypothetical protein